MNENVYKTIGLCLKAGKLIYGTYKVLDRYKKYNDLKLIIVAIDAPVSVKQRYKDFTITRFVLDRETISKILGRNSEIVIGILDEGFSSLISSGLGG